MLKFTASSALIATLMLCIALPAHAQWKWKDAAGKIQYSDLPPPNGTPDKDILTRPPGQKLQVFVPPPPGSVPASAPARTASGPSKAELDSQAKLKQQEQEQAAKQKEEERRMAAQRRENCGYAQDNLKLLDSGVRITRANERGENIPLDDKQRAAEQQRSRAVIASECK